MAEREAAVKLTLDNAQFMVTIKRTGDAVDAVGKRGKKSMDLFGAGIASAKRGLGNLAQSLKGTLAMAASLGGAFTVGQAVQQAVKLRSSYEQVAFGIRQATGNMMQAAEVQAIVERSAAKTTRTNDEMAGSFDRLWHATGDLDFSRDALESIGTTATATGADLEMLTTLADQLHTKFEVSAGGMQTALAQLHQAGEKGGPSFAEFADIISNVGAELMAAGIQGERGLQFMLGAMVKTDDAFNNLPKQVAGLKAALRGLGDAGELKKLGEKIGIDPKKLINEKDAIARLKMIFSKGTAGADALLSGMNEGEEKRTMELLFTDPFKAALKDAQATGLKGKAAIDAALVTFDGGLKKFGKSTATAAQVEEQAARMAAQPAAQLRVALDRLNTAFSQPEIINAINELTKALPDLAKLVGEIVAFAARNPIASLAVAGGAKVGGDMLMGMAGEALKKGLGVGGAAAGAGAGALGAGAGAAAGFMGGGVMASAAAAGPIVAAIAAGGLLVGEQIKAAYDDEEGIMRELSSATMGGLSGGGSIKQLEAKLARLEQAKSAAREANIGGGVTGWMGSALSPLTGLDAKAGADEAQKLAQEATAKIQRRIRELENEASKRNLPGSPDAPAATKPEPVALDRSAPRMIAEATMTALGGTILTVKMAPGSSGIGSATPGPGGSRGPMQVPPARQGGAV